MKCKLNKWIACILTMALIFSNISMAMASNEVEIDSSHTSDGYIEVKFTGQTDKRLKVIIQKGQSKYTYDLNNKGKTEVYPLQMGDGSYSVKAYKNISGTKYSTIYSTTVDVKLRSSYAPFSVPSQYVNYTAESKTVKKAEELTKNCKDDLEKVEKVYEYIITNIVYDTQKARLVQPGYLPTVDTTLQDKKGICFDYAAIMAAMLRSQGIPTKLVTGYVSPNNVYHAWNEVYIKEIGWIKVYGVYFDGQKWKLMDSTFGASGKNSKSIQEYIGNGSNYSVKYEY